jgi:hypothetical protein
MRNRSSGEARRAVMNWRSVAPPVTRSRTYCGLSQARRRIASNSASTSVSVSLASIALGPSKLAALRRPTRCSSGTV